MNEDPFHKPPAQQEQNDSANAYRAKPPCNHPDMGEERELQRAMRPDHWPEPGHNPNLFCGCETTRIESYTSYRVGQKSFISLHEAKVEALLSLLFPDPNCTPTTEHINALERIIHSPKEVIDILTWHP